MEAEAEAEAIALRGDAQAFAIEAKAKAEAEQMAKKADAWNEYGKAALMDMMLKVKFFFIRFHLGLETVYNYSPKFGHKKAEAEQMVKKADAWNEYGK